ncbi:hypothetical protein [Deinococcus peraridilitoris]|uniref:Uncharacterized protein n=1 Tax=Deinococcus peraridilitoris (strain DSM 19664 / LMG 22246 / CIP 109416 / KR-200) TaxID=937777 RepID=K9ZWT9_DEIPD|nr:hypothetical protein [Deinococcus peraridilitoris]AFZ66046.1 hypothetical protein Deipe_0450 [Deinococcus peraridilitoris DSM 19664]
MHPNDKVAQRRERKKANREKRREEQLEREWHREMLELYKSETPKDERVRGV